jgi:hypothetical protein
MYPSAGTRNWNSLAAGALGVAAAFFATAYLLGMQVPFVSTDRAAIYVLAATGFGMCILNMGRTTRRLGWTHPVTVAGLCAGALIVLLVAAVAAGWRVPLLTEDRNVFVGVAMIGLMKWALGVFSRLYLQA